MGMTVTVQETGTKEKEIYKIVGTTEADILAETPRISNESPVGKAILGKQKGDSFKLKNGSGDQVEYSILEVA
jgi:transcription elongation factor GreA